MKKTVVDILKQMIPVIFGILIALFINSWNEDRKNQNYIHNIFTSISAELKESKEAIDQNIPKQRRLKDSIQANLSNNQLPLIEIAQRAGGLYAPQIRTNSWIAISRTKIELVDYEKLKILTDIENLKELLNEKLKYLMNFAFSNMQSTSSEVKNP